MDNRIAKTRCIIDCINRRLVEEARVPIKTDNKIMEIHCK
jgi:hypothetical protein